MTRAVYSPVEYDVFIGIDSDKRSYAFTVKKAREIWGRSKKIPAHPEHLCQYIKKTFGDTKVICAYEAGPTGFELYDYLNSNGVACMVTPPQTIPRAPGQRVKTNRIDSEKLTQHLANGDLRGVRVPQGVYRELRHLIAMRELYASRKRSTKQRIKALLLYTGISPKEAEQRWSRRYLDELERMRCSEAVRIRLDRLLNDLASARAELLAIHRELKTFCTKHTDIERNRRFLCSVPGIGFITALSLLARSGDPGGLQNQRELAAFIGLVPSEHSTGDKVNKGSITRLGNRTVRFLFIESAWTAIRQDTELRQFYERIKTRHHPKVGARKAIVAVARKLTQISYRVLKDQRNYRIHSSCNTMA